MVDIAQALVYFSGDRFPTNDPPQDVRVNVIHLIESSFIELELLTSTRQRLSFTLFEGILARLPVTRPVILANVSAEFYACD